MVGKSNPIDQNMGNMIKEVSQMSTAQRNIPAKTGNDILAATRKMVEEAFSDLPNPDAKGLTGLDAAVIDAFSKAIVLGVMKDKYGTKEK